MYVVLWIPRVTKATPAKICNSLSEKPLRDIPNTQGVVVKATIKENLNIDFYYKEEKDSDFMCLNLLLVDASTDGYLQYKYEVPESNDDFVSDSLRKEFHKAFYHYLKQFFHNHIHHGVDEDSLLAPFVSERQIDFKVSADNKVVAQNYLQSYTEKFEGCTAATLSTIEDVVGQIFKGQDVSKNITFLQKYVLHNRAISNEIFFAKFLQKIHKKNGVKFEDQKLEDAISSFVAANDNLQFWYDHYLNITSFKAGNVSVALGWIGTILGTVSLVLTLFLEDRHTKDTSIKDGFARIEHEINTENQSIEDLSSRQLEFDQKIDSALNAIDGIKVEVKKTQLNNSQQKQGNK